MAVMGTLQTGKINDMVSQTQSSHLPESKLDAQDVLHLLGSLVGFQGIITNNK